MRTTIDIPAREHALFTSLARAQNVSLGKLLVALAERGLKASSMVGEAAPSYTLDAETGLGVFRSGHPVTLEVVKAFQDEG